MEYSNICLNNNLIYNHDYVNIIIEEQNYIMNRNYNNNTTTRRKEKLLYDMEHKFFISNENVKTDENSYGNIIPLENNKYDSDASLISLPLNQKIIIMDPKIAEKMSEEKSIQEENDIVQSKEKISLNKQVARNRIRYDNNRTKFVRKTLNHFFPETISIFVRDDPHKKLKSFPEEFIRRISLVRKGEYLDRKLISLYEDIKLFETEKKKKPGKYTKTQIENFDEFMGKPGLKEILDMTFKELVEMYIISGKFVNDIKSMKENEENKNFFRLCGKNFIYEYKPKKKNTFLIFE
jgi:hypothetical protein